MFRILMTTAAVAGLAMTGIATGAVAQTHHYYRHHHHHARHYEGCQQAQHDSRVRGAVVGSVGGALIGNSVSHGNRTGGTLLGAGLGALTGNALGRSAHPC